MSVSYASTLPIEKLQIYKQAYHAGSTPARSALKSPAMQFHALLLCETGLMNSVHWSPGFL